ncbi:MAG: winged helix-turn-helix domain-containing protein, partial [Myxococcota bacterium]
MGTQRWRWPGVEVDLEQRSVETSEGTESLTAKESGVLRYLLDRPGVTIARDELLREVWKQPRPGRTRAVDHVVRRLRNKLGDDARRPSILFSDYGDGYRIETPRQSRAERTRLPLEPDPVVGRVAELDTIRELLDAHPIVVLTGPGGIGKSRLALRVAHAVGDAHGPVTWIDTSGVRTPEGLAWCVARRLDVPLAPVAPVERLGDTLADGPPRLLVLDGLEQMADVAVDLLAQWRDAAEGARFLITSRVSLPMRAVEQILAPLGKPDARALFEQHASRSLGPGTAAPLLEALGGLPLAIELAATRARERPLADVLNDVTNRPTRLALPGTGPRFPGHRSLVACVEASRGWIGSATWDAWLALGVFEGPVRRDA